MGYYTDYSLTFEGSVDADQLEADLDSVTGYSWDSSFEEYGIKWYHHEDDMRKISKMYPDALFTLEGEGEESGDIWRKYFKNGKMQHAHAEVVIADFDETLLK